ncbi:transmembrane protease serine 2 [Cheilinus undulatus]|uniref:transmembrane protease serine 2 n=1 Tax=Cheilinus undulatus TaxID=241271 RepID=UPI001BD35E9A|nr:transmembrane protease serine 2 [Cheilinus undulatus]
MDNNQIYETTYDNVGYHHDEVRPPPYNQQHNSIYPTLPMRTPTYVTVTPSPVINTHHTVTPGIPEATAAPVTQTAPYNTGQTKGRKKCHWRSILCATLCVLLVLGVLALLLWYFLYYQCLLGRSCRDGGKCLSLSQWCDGVQDCTHGEDEAQCFRLHGTNFLLESFSADTQKWMPVCAENWDNSYGRAVCEHIGYKSRDYVSSGETSAGSSASDGYMKLKSGSDHGSRIQSQLRHSKSCSSRAVSLRCVDCGQSSAAPSSRIVGGTEAVEGAWPWQVSLMYRGHHTCGGSIISSKWILSAAHCFQNAFASPSQWRVFHGGLSLNVMSHGSGQSIVKIITHEKFDDRTNDYDIAVLQLHTSMPFSRTVKPVCLPNIGVDLSAERQAWITGWGALRSSGPSPDKLNQAQVTIYSREICNHPRVLNGEVTETMICAGKLEGGVDTCQGDSGGPLVVKQAGVWWLVGDTSWGIGCALRNKPGVYGNVTFFIDWVYTQMQSEW